MVEKTFGSIHLSKALPAQDFQHTICKPRGEGGKGISPSPPLYSLLVRRASGPNGLGVGVLWRQLDSLQVVAAHDAMSVRDDLGIGIGANLAAVDDEHHFGTPSVASTCGGNRFEGTAMGHWIAQD